MDLSSEHLICFIVVKETQVSFYLCIQFYIKVIAVCTCAAHILHWEKLRSFSSGCWLGVADWCSSALSLF